MHDVSKPLLTTAIHLRESLTMTDLRTFDPNSVGQKTENIFGLPFTADEAAIAVIPVPWEVTVSYREGTASGPEAILAASYQVDLYDPDYVDAWRIGLAMEEIPTELRNLNDEMRPTAEEYIGMLEEGHTPEDSPLMKQMLEKNQCLLRKK
jgi:agmatinase